MENENFLKENKKKNIIIIILTIIIICLLVFICLDKTLNKDNKNKEQEKKQEETNNNVNDNENKEENNNKNEENSNIATEDINTLIEKSKNYIERYDFQNVLPFANIADLDSQIFLRYAINELEWEETFTEEEVETVIKNYIGNEYQVKHQNIKCNTCTKEPLYKYNAKTKTYTYNTKHGGHGGDGRGVYAKYIDGNNTNNTYTLNFKIVYSNPTGDVGIPYKYYKSVADSNNNKNVIFECPELNDENYVYAEMNDEYFKTFEDQLPITTFTYEKSEDGTFNLKSVTIK